VINVLQIILLVHDVKMSMGLIILDYVSHALIRIAIDVLQITLLVHSAKKSMGLIEVMNVSHALIRIAYNVQMTYANSVKRDTL